MAKMELVARGEPNPKREEFKWDEVTTGHSCDTITNTLECSETVFVEGVGVTYHSARILRHEVPRGAGCGLHQPAIEVCDDDDDECPRTVWVEGKPDSEKKTKLYRIARDKDPCKPSCGKVGPILQKKVYVGE